jgi:putative toxin-antitoxin system antitoxin component (TIGR02293 family)
MKYDEASVVQRLLPRAKQDFKIREEGSPAVTLVAQIRRGLPFAEFRALIVLLGIPEEDLGRLLGISPATLNRRKRAHSLAMPESERVVRFARLFGLAMEVFGTEEAAREWLKTPNPGTAGETPLSYADTEFGARAVENLLGRLDHGIF